MRAVILDNLRSAHNTGSVIRTVSALNYDSIALCGVTATPDKNKLGKTSRGLDSEVNWIYFESTEQALSHFKENNYKVYALEYTKRSTNFTEFQPEKNIAWIIGNEALGVSPKVLEKCDEVFHLPMLNKKASINVSCAFSAIAYTDFFKQTHV